MGALSDNTRAMVDREIDRAMADKAYRDKHWINQRSGQWYDIAASQEAEGHAEFAAKLRAYLDLIELERVEEQVKAERKKNQFRERLANILEAKKNA